MIQILKNAGNPRPKYEEMGYVFSITLPFKEPIRNIITEITQNELSKLNSRQQEIISILRSGPKKGSQIAASMHVVSPNRTLQSDLLKLKALGFINSAGTTKSDNLVSI